MRETSIYCWVAATLLYLFAASPAQAVDVIVSGGNTFLVIDVDGDGPDEVEDCRSVVNLDVYLPVTDDGHFTVANADAPDDLFIDIGFNSLTDCRCRLVRQLKQSKPAIQKLAVE